jgi:hypothetical protein
VVNGSNTIIDYSFEFPSSGQNAIDRLEIVRGHLDFIKGRGPRSIYSKVYLSHNVSDKQAAVFISGFGIYATEPKEDKHIAHIQVDAVVEQAGPYLNPQDVHLDEFEIDKYKVVRLKFTVQCDDQDWEDSKEDWNKAWIAYTVIAHTK